MKKRKSIGLDVVYFIDFLLAGLYFLNVVYFYLSMRLLPHLPEAVAIFYRSLFLWLPLIILLIALGILVLKRKPSSIILHIAFYSFFGLMFALKLLFPLMSSICRIRPLSAIFVDLPIIFYNCSPKIFLWLLPSIWVNIAVNLNLLVYVIISIGMIVYFTRSKVKNQFRR